MITLNIGLARNDGAPDNSLGKTLATLTASMPYDSIVDVRTAQSSTERTLVVLCKETSLIRIHRTALMYLCEQLAQDCVALSDAPGLGELIGPNAKKWGSFDPDYFINF